MTKIQAFFYELISNESVTSSARFLNVYGGIVLSLIFIVDFATNRVINIDAFYALAAYLWGTHPIDPATKTAYAARNGALLDAVASGGLTLRGDFDDMDVVMQRLLGCAVKYPSRVWRRL